MLPALLVVAPPTPRFAFARDRLARDEWRPAYKLSSGRLWWRCLRLAAERGQLHPCAQRLAKHLSWHPDDQCALTDIRALLAGYAAYHRLSLRTAWTDWGRLVAAGWLFPTRAPANQGRNQPQGPGSGRAARYVLTTPANLITQLRLRSCRSMATSLDTSFSLEVSPSPSVPPHRQDQVREWVTPCSSTLTQRRDASALLAGCHESWRQQRPNNELLTRPDWQRLLPLVAQVQRERPDMPLTAILTERVRSARSLPEVLAWRLWRLLRQSRLQETRPDQLPRQPAPCTYSTTVEETTDQHPHLSAVRTQGGPAAVRASLAAAGEHPNTRTGAPEKPTRTTCKAPARHFPH